MPSEWLLLLWLWTVSRWLRFVFVWRNGTADRKCTKSYWAFSCGDIETKHTGMYRIRTVTGEMTFNMTHCTAQYYRIFGKEFSGESFRENGIRWISRGNSNFSEDFVLTCKRLANSFRIEKRNPIGSIDGNRLNHWDATGSQIQIMPFFFNGNNFPIQRLVNGRWNFWRIFLLCKSRFTTFRFPARIFNAVCQHSIWEKKFHFQTSQNGRSFTANKFKMAAYPRMRLENLLMTKLGARTLKITLCNK